jgi:hypothetical protein
LQKGPFSTEAALFVVHSASLLASGRRVIIGCHKEWYREGMGKRTNRLKAQWEQIRGDLKYDITRPVWRWLYRYVVGGGTFIMTAFASWYAYAMSLSGPAFIQFVFIIAASCLVVLTLVVTIANRTYQWWAFRRWEQGKLPPPSYTPTPKRELKTASVKVEAIKKDPGEDNERKHQLRLFIERKMQPCWWNMIRTMDQVNGQLREKGGAHRYYVRALQYFMKPLENSGARLNTFLTARATLDLSDFAEAQKMLAQLYRVYEERMPWVRDLVWYTNPNIQKMSYYKDWREADREMREALTTLLPQYPLLSEQITQTDTIDSWWWEKTPNL